MQQRSLQQQLFERTAHQTLSLSVGRRGGSVISSNIPLISFDRIADSSVGLKLPSCGLLCEPKLYLICSRLGIPACATKWRVVLYLPGMLACAATAMRAGHSFSVCTFLPCFGVSSYTPENVAYWCLLLGPKLHLSSHLSRQQEEVEFMQKIRAPGSQTELTVSGESQGTNCASGPFTIFLPKCVTSHLGRQVSVWQAGARRPTFILHPMKDFLCQTPPETDPFDRPPTVSWLNRCFRLMREVLLLMKTFRLSSILPISSHKCYVLVWMVRPPVEVFVDWAIWT